MDNLKELKKYESMWKDKEKMLTLTHDLLSYRTPSKSYPVFLFEHMTLFHIKDLKEGRPWKIVTPSQVLETLTQSDFLSRICYVSYIYMIGNS